MPPASTALELKKIDEGTYAIVRKTTLSKEVIVECAAIIAKSFQHLNPEFAGVLVERAQENGFTDEEFMKSVKEVVDTCIYSTPTIANFISRKKPETIINYQKMLDLTDKFGELIWDSYEKVQVNGRTFWREKR